MTFGPRTRSAHGPRASMAAFAAMAAVAALATATPARAQNGLGAMPADWLWPQIQARITLQAASPSAMAAAHLADGPAAGRALLGAGVLGDIVLAARPSLGSLRATSGLLLGQSGGAPASGLALAPRLSIALQEGGFVGAEPLAGRAYVGLGYDSPALWGSLSIHADLGLAASQWGGVGRALTGQHGWDTAVRELRLTPHVQLGLRYAF